MTTERFNKPPPISTPKNAPWTDAQAIQYYLSNLNDAINSMGSKFDSISTNLAALIDLLQPQGGGGGGAGGGGTKGVGAIQLRSNVDDAGTATGGSNTTLTDSGKYWSANVWAGTIILMQIGNQFYTSKVVSNTDQTITFAALPTGVKVNTGSPYAIKSINPTVTSLWLPSNPAVIYDSGVAPAAGIYYSSLVNCLSLNNELFYVVNTTDKIATIDLVGNIINSPTGMYLLDYPSTAVPALIGVLGPSIDLTGDDWGPYTGVQITIPAGVTLGKVVIQEVHR